MTEIEAKEILDGIDEVRGDLPEDGDDVEIALMMAKDALEIVAKMKEHCEGSCTDCPYWNPKFDKCMNDLLKGVNEHVRE